MSSVPPVASITPAVSVTGDELARLETQLADWVHCPSAGTAAGKAKIEEISGKIEAIKSEAAKKAEEARQSPAAAASAAHGLRFDGQGAWLDVEA